MQIQRIRWPAIVVSLLIVSALGARVHSYLWSRGVVDDAWKCRQNVKNVYVACQMYQTDMACWPPSMERCFHNLNLREPRCPFDGSLYLAEKILVTEENLKHFPQGLVEVVPGVIGVRVSCTSPLHAELEPGLEPGYGYANFGQPLSPLLREDKARGGGPSKRSSPFELP